MWVWGCSEWCFSGSDESFSALQGAVTSWILGDWPKQAHPSALSGNLPALCHPCRECWWGLCFQAPSQLSSAPSQTLPHCTHLVGGGRALWVSPPVTFVSVVRHLLWEFCHESDLEQIHDICRQKKLSGMRGTRGLMVLLHTLPAALCWEPAGSPEPSQLTPAGMLPQPSTSPITPWLLSQAPGCRLCSLHTIPGISPSLGTPWHGDSECVELRLGTAVL